MVHLSDEQAIVKFVILRLANIEPPTGTNFEDVWSKFVTRSGGMFHFSTTLTMSYKEWYSIFFPHHQEF